MPSGVASTCTGRRFERDGFRLLGHVKARRIGAARVRPCGASCGIERDSFGGNGAVASGRIPLLDDGERTLHRFERKPERNILAAQGRGRLARSVQVAAIAVSGEVPMVRAAS